MRITFAELCHNDCRQQGFLNLNIYFIRFIQMKWCKAMCWKIEFSDIKFSNFHHHKKLTNFPIKKNLKWENNIVLKLDFEQKSLISIYFLLLFDVYKFVGHITKQILLTIILWTQKCSENMNCQTLLAFHWHSCINNKIKIIKHRTYALREHHICPDLL